MYHVARQEPTAASLLDGVNGNKLDSSVLVEVGSLEDDAPTRNGGPVSGVSFNRDSRAESGVLCDSYTEEEGDVQPPPEDNSAIMPSNEAGESTGVCEDGPCSGRKHEATSTILGGTSTPPPADFTDKFAFGRYNTFMARRTQGALELASEVCRR